MEKLGWRCNTMLSLAWNKEAHESQINAGCGQPKLQSQTQMPCELVHNKLANLDLDGSFEGQQKGRYPGARFYVVL